MMLLLLLVTVRGELDNVGSTTLVDPPLQQSFFHSCSLCNKNVIIIILLLLLVVV